MSSRQKKNFYKTALIKYWTRKDVLNLYYYHIIEIAKSIKNITL